MLKRLWGRLRPLDAPLYDPETDVVIIQPIHLVGAAFWAVAIGFPFSLLLAVLP